MLGSQGSNVGKPDELSQPSTGPEHMSGNGSIGGSPTNAKPQRLKVTPSFDNASQFAPRSADPPADSPPQYAENDAAMVVDQEAPIGSEQNGLPETSSQDPSASVSPLPHAHPVIHQHIYDPVDSDVAAVRQDHHHYGEAIDHDDIGFDELHDPHGSQFERPKEFELVRQEVGSGELPVVVLAASEGGRSTTALALANSCKQREARRIGPLSGSKVTANQLALHPESTWLLDLTDSDEEFKWNDLLERFAGLTHHVRNQRSVLIVIAKRGDLSGPEIQKRGIVRTLSCPDPYGVFERQLQSALLRAELEKPARHAKDWRTSFEARQQLHGEVPAVAVRLAEAVRDAEQYWAALTPPEREDTRKKLVERRKLTESAEAPSTVEALAIDRFQTWEDELDRWNEQHEKEPRLKAFQVAAAMLPSGDPIQVRRAASDLIASIGRTTETNKVTSVPHHGLQGPGTRLLVRKSLAQLKEGKISFPRPGFSEAVVRYFWEDWPEHRPQFLSWMMKLATDKKISAVDQQELKRRISDFAIHHAQERDELDFLKGVISRWARVESTLKDAADLLERAATTSRIFSKVRTFMLQWAAKGDLARKRVVAEVCASEEFARNHPRLVMTRLSHLIVDENSREYEGTLLKTCHLLIDGSGHTREVLDWLASSMNAEDSAESRAAQLFLEIATVTPENSPIPFVLSESMRSDVSRSNVISIWASVFRKINVNEAETTFHVWSECCTVPAIADQVLSIFRAAMEITIDEAITATKSVGRLAHRWSKKSSLPEETCVMIDGKLSTACRDVKIWAEDNVIEAIDDVAHA